MPGASFNVSPPPLQSPFTLDKNGVLTSQPWIAWLARITFPVLTAAYDAQTSIETLTELGKHGPPNHPGEDLALGSFAPRTAAQTPNTFPPQTPRAVADSPLALLAAGRFGSQQPIWSLSDTHANRSKYPNSAYPVDALFLETDRLLLYRNTGTAWKYAAGQYDDTLANIPALGTNDAGALFGVTDYGHVLRWSGAAWGWAPGESGSGYFQDFAVAPTGAGWHACDGSAGVVYLKADGTTGTVTLPNTAGSAAYRRNAAAYAAAITAAAVPTISGHTETGTAVIPPVLSGSGFAQITGSTGNDAGAGQVVQSGAGATVAAHTHTHPTAGTVTDTGHQHVVSPADTGHQHNLTSANAPIALPGDPVAHYSAITYFRQ